VSSSWPDRNSMELIFFAWVCRARSSHASAILSNVSLSLPFIDSAIRTQSRAYPRNFSVSDKPASRFCARYRRNTICRTGFFNDFVRKQIGAAEIVGRVNFSSTRRKCLDLCRARGHPPRTALLRSGFVAATDGASFGRFSANWLCLVPKLLSLPALGPLRHIDGICLLCRSCSHLSRLG